MTAALRVLAPGLMTTLQDLGRPGYQHLGVPVSGALDHVSLRAANLLVGNAAGCGRAGDRLSGADVARGRRQRPHRPRRGADVHRHPPADSEGSGRRLAPYESAACCAGRC